MTPPLFEDSQHWRSRAEEARLIAEGIPDPEAKQLMLDIAKRYARIAERAANRAIGRANED